MSTLDTIRNEDLYQVGPQEGDFDGYTCDSNCLFESFGYHTGGCHLETASDIAHQQSSEVALNRSREK